MKQFLRFQISGLTCMFWVILFLLPYLDVGKLIEIGEGKAITALIGLVTLALPLGTIIHQISITVFSPFRDRRFCNRRSVLNDLKQLATSLEVTNKDRKNQCLLVLHQGIRISWKDSDVEKDLDVEYLREEVSNRYSYYYVRIDNGLLAPVFAVLIFCLLKHYLQSSHKELFLLDPTLAIWVIPVAATVICLLVLLYIPALLKEVDDLERLLLEPDRYIPSLRAVTTQATNTPDSAPDAGQTLPATEPDLVEPGPEDRDRAT